MTRLDLYVESALEPLDLLRSRLLRRIGGALGPLLRDRDARVAVLGFASVASAFVLALWAPLFMLGVTPLLLGVPHLLGDLRYLVVRQGLQRRQTLLAVVAPCLLMTVVSPRSGWGAVAVGLTALLAEAPLARRMFAFAGSAVIAYLLHGAGHAADVVVAHGHNLVALFIWARWARAPRAWIPGCIALALAALCMASGALDASMQAGLTARPFVDSGAMMRSLSPLSDPVWSARLVVFFAFAQAVHYSVWLKLIPEQDRARASVRSFRASYRALRRDLGRYLPATALALTLLFCAVGLADVSVARHWYLRLALFHGPLEIAVLLLLALEARPPVREPAHAG